MPGMENLAPERQETNSGLVGSPNFLPACFSTSLRAASIWSHMTLREFTGLAEFITGFGGDGETGRNRHSGACHIGQACAFPTQQTPYTFP